MATIAATGTMVIFLLSQETYLADFFLLSSFMKLGKGSFLGLPCLLSGRMTHSALTQSGDTFDDNVKSNSRLVASKM